MTTEALQNKKVQHLTHARALITQAMGVIREAQKEIQQALGDTDVGDLYQGYLDIVLEDLDNNVLEDLDNDIEDLKHT